jgi:hypothetical protein
VLGFDSVSVDIEIVVGLAVLVVEPSFVGIVVIVVGTVSVAELDNVIGTELVDDCVASDVAELSFAGCVVFPDDKPQRGTSAL